MVDVTINKHRSIRWSYLRQQPLRRAEGPCCTSRSNVGSLKFGIEMLEICLSFGRFQLVVFRCFFKVGFFLFGQNDWLRKSVYCHHTEVHLTFAVLVWINKRRMTTQPRNISWTCSIILDCWWFLQEMLVVVPSKQFIQIVQQLATLNWSNKISQVGFLANKAWTNNGLAEIHWNPLILRALAVSLGP